MENIWVGYYVYRNNSCFVKIYKCNCIIIKILKYWIRFWLFLFFYLIDKYEMLICVDVYGFMMILNNIIEEY